MITGRVGDGPNHRFDNPWNKQLHAHQQQHTDDGDAQNPGVVTSVDEEEFELFQRLNPFLILVKFIGL
jgi:hypothetical protein